MRAAFLGLLLLTVGAASADAQQPASSNDPYIWLEDVSSPRSMDWVNSHNAKTQAVLEADPRYQQYYNEALEIAQAQDRIPYGSFTHNQIYNFWQDADHVRGILRRTTRASYESGQPAWTTVLDVDALAKAEKANWVFKGMNCARPAERRCLISLSDGGEDAVTVREFDLATAKFVPNGFVLPKGKQDATWVDENTLLISREWHKGELSRTGYPYILKRLKRGQPLSAAVEVFRGKPDDGGYGVGAFVLRDGQNRTLPLISRPLDTFRSET
jgi:prolyl oligopeptidase